MKGVHRYNDVVILVTLEWFKGNEVTSRGYQRDPPIINNCLEIFLFGGYTFWSVKDDSVH